jgi:Short C-terminal domain
MSGRRHALWAALIVVAGFCSIGGGGCIGVAGDTNPPTRGQELIDLKSALDRGAITQTEYDAAKARILERK